MLVLGALGTLSDRKGRRVELLIATAGMILNHCNIILVGNFSQTLGPYFLLFGALLEGLSGGPMLSLLAACHAYVSDCVAPERRFVSTSNKFAESVMYNCQN